MHAKLVLEKLVCESFSSPGLQCSVVNKHITTKGGTYHPRTLSKVTRFQASEAHRLKFTPLEIRQTTELLFTGFTRDCRLPNTNVVSKIIAGNERVNFLSIEPLPQLAVRTVKTFSVDRTTAYPVMPREIAVL
jgi:hypothetical protein